jgi:ABC-type nitrate/sulfonate/bicarbonate transport system substrate-binding protein
MRKRWLLLGAVLATTAIAAPLSSTAVAAPKLTKVTLQLKWVTQAQFAGYYAAAAQGYYKNAGLDVTIKVGGEHHPETVVAGNRAEFGLDGCRTSSPRARRARSSSPSPRSSPGRA